MNWDEFYKKYKNGITLSGTLDYFNNDYIPTSNPYIVRSVQITLPKEKIVEKLKDIDNNALHRGDYILYVHRRLGLTYGRVIHHTEYGGIKIVNVEEFNSARVTLGPNAKVYLLDEDSIPDTIKENADNHKFSLEWWG